MNFWVFFRPKALNLTKLDHKFTTQRSKMSNFNFEAPQQLWVQFYCTAFSGHPRTRCRGSAQERNPNVLYPRTSQSSQRQCPVTEQHLWCSCCTAFLASVACACTTRVDPRWPSWNTRTCVAPHKSWLHCRAPSYSPPIAAPFVSSTPKAKWLQRSVTIAVLQWRLVLNQPTSGANRSSDQPGNSSFEAGLSSAIQNRLVAKHIGFNVTCSE